MNAGTQYFNKRNDELNEGIWQSLATYVFHSAAIEEARERATSKKQPN